VKALESTIHHASARIDWLDASGYQEAGRARRSTVRLELRPSRAPRGLQIVHRPGRSLLWLDPGQPGPDPARAGSLLHPVIPGRAGEADRRYPQAVALFELRGSVRDPRGIYHPRDFSLNTGRGQGQGVRLFRTVAATRPGSAGGIRGLLRYEDGRPASWALVSLQVRLHTAGQLNFLAQAGRSGEFLLAMDRVPALKKDAPRPDYEAELSVRGEAAASGAELADPDAPGVRDLLIEAPDHAGQFSTSARLQVRPGPVQQITSQGKGHLVLRPPS